MIQLILSLFIAALLVSSLLFLARRKKPRAEQGAQGLVEAREALDALQAGLLPFELVGQIFAKSDLDYVTSQTPERVCKLFLNERKTLALSWVRQVRGQVLTLGRFHRGSARFYARLDLLTEVELALGFTALSLACRGLQILLYVRGPYAVPGMIRATVSAAARVCEISERSLAFLSPAQQ